MQWVLINGPPGCGKDTLVNGLAAYIAFMHLKVSSPLKRMLAAMLNVDLRWIEENKDTKVLMLGGITVRQALIDMSEKYMKVLYGEDIMGRIAHDRARYSANRLTITSDSGFTVESERIIHNAGKINCIIIRVHRDGCTFDGDSREWMPDGLCWTYDIYNDTSKDQLVMFGLRIITRRFASVKLLKEPDWVRL